MIFEKVENITRKEEFLEKILLYIRLVEVLAGKNNLVIPKITEATSAMVLEMSDMGIIDDSDQLPLLKKTIGANYERFISSVAFYLEHKDIYTDKLDKLNNKKRALLQEEESKKNKPSMVDFFAGAGGLSCGFTQAGFGVKFANDFEDVCVRTYRFNHPELPSCKVLKEDIRKIVNNIDDYVSGSIDIVVGGPPCQGFSSANQQRIIDDPRNELYKYYIEAIKKICPKFVLMENVF